ncbi:MAG: hypothetical protein HQ523_03110 [Lentisphaerae bacterium]|nr:hypothetical protein [Lentisphaerota bacterium]
MYSRTTRRRAGVAAIITMAVAVLGTLPCVARDVSATHQQLIRSEAKTVGGALDTTDWVVSVRTVLTNAEPQGVSVTSKVSAALWINAQLRDKVVDWVEHSGEAPPEISDGWRDMLTAMSSQLARDTLAVRAGVSSATNIVEPWKRDGHTYLYGGVDYGDLIAGTADSSPAAFAWATDASADVMRLALLESKAMNLVARRDLIALSEALLGLDSRWDDYYKAMRQETPLDTVVNNWRFGGGEGLVFREPPVSQMVLLHPTPGVEIGKLKLDEVRPTVLVEVIGWYWPSVPVINTGLGASLTASYTMGDIDGARWGGGALLHISKHFTVGVTIRDTGDSTDVIPILALDAWNTAEDAIKKVRQPF